MSLTTEPNSQSTFSQLTECYIAKSSTTVIAQQLQQFQTQSHLKYVQNKSIMAQLEALK